MPKIIYSERPTPNWLKPNSKSEIFLVSPDPQKIHGLEHAWPHLKLLTSRSSPYLRAAKKRGTDITYLKLPKIKDTAKLLTQPNVKRLLKRGSRLLVFKAHPRVEKICKASGWKLLMPEANYLNLLEDKFNFLEFCKKNRLPILPAKLQVLNRIKFQNPIVAQLRHGHAGETTFFIRNQAELKKLQNRIGEYQVKLTPLKKLPTFSLNLCVTRDGIYLTQPFYQITGDLRLNPNPCGSGGIDLDLAQKMLSPETKQKILATAEKFGRTLKKIGYRGIAGIDLLVDNSKQKIWLLECNPRLLANLGYLTRRQAECKEVPLLTLHILDYLGTDLAKLKIPKLSQLKSGRQEIKHD